MKRFLAILLLSVHLFYIGGYNLAFQYYIHRSEVKLVKQIFDNKVDEAKLIEIKIPVHFPTMQDWTDYEVIQGQIQLKDTFYNYVRLKMTRDTMFFVCIPNTAKTELVKANIITAKQINDVPVSKKGQVPTAKKISSLSEYNLHAFKYQYSAFETQLKPDRKPLQFSITNPFVESPGKPPSRLS